MCLSIPLEVASLHSIVRGKSKAKAKAIIWYLAFGILIVDS